MSDGGGGGGGGGAGDGITGGPAEDWKISGQLKIES